MKEVIDSEEKLAEEINEMKYHGSYQ